MKERLGRRLSTTVAALVALMAIVALVPASASAQFQLGLQDSGFTDAPGSTPAQIAFGALSTVHGSTVRLFVKWDTVAPGGATKPSGFDAANPADPKYDWTAVDTAVRDLAARHDHVLLLLTGQAPAWATPAGEPASDETYGGSWDPNPQEFGLFAHAAALRYSGHFGTIPRVTEWEVWNEENLPEDLIAPNLVSEYRSLLNAGYAGIKSASSANTVAVGGLAPVGFIKGLSVSPLKFAAQLMCMRRVRTHFVRGGRCPVKAHFDVLGIHPYSLDSTPTLHAYYYDDVLIADLGKLTTLLRAAEKLHTAAPAHKYGLWVTEWSWFSNPPDNRVGDSPSTSARYTAYSMYEMWRAGVSLVSWFLARDPKSIGVNSPSLVYGGGLEYSSGKPKPMMQAYRFPVVAGAGRGRGFVWGRAPVSSRTGVIVEQAKGRSWKRVGTVYTGSDGVFELRFSARRNAVYRARIPHGSASLGYDSRPIPAVRTHSS